MNSFSPSKNPPAAVWKASLRMLGILLLSFLFMPEGWGQGNDLDVSNTSQIPSNAGIVVLTYADNGSWQYQVKDGGQAPQPFSGTLTTGHATGSDPFTAGFYFIIKKADENQTNIGGLTLTDFHFSGTNGVFLIEGGSVKITANTSCTLKNPTTDADNTSVIRVDPNSQLTLDGGNDGMTVQNTQEKPDNYGLYNEGKITLYGKVTVTAAVPVYLATGALLSSDFDARVMLASPVSEAISVETTSPDLFGSSFLEWRFETPPASGSTLVLTEAGIFLGDDPFVFPLDGNNKNFAVNAYLLICHSELKLNNMKLMGKKPGTDDYTGSFEIDGRVKEFVIYEDVAEYRKRVSNLAEFKNALENYNDFPSGWIRFERDITFSSTEDFPPCELYHDINIDGRGYTLTPSATHKNFNIPASAEGTLTLTNVTVNCPNTPLEQPFIRVEHPQARERAKITFGKGFKMTGGASNTDLDPYGVDMQAGTLIIEDGAEITESTDGDGVAIRIASGAKLNLSGGKIHGNSGYGLYLCANGDDYPEVIIKSPLPDDSKFEGLYLDSYAHEAVVIKAGGDYKLTPDDLSKFKLKTIRLPNNGGTFDSGYELYLDETANAIKVRPCPPLLISDITFDPVEEGYRLPAAKTITIENPASIEVYIDPIKLDDDAYFTIAPLRDLLTRLGPNSTNTEFTIQPKEGLPADTYTATIQVKATDIDLPYTAKVSFTVNPPAPVDPDPIPEYVYYQVTLPQVPGVETDPVAGTYLVGEGDAFRFRLTVLPDYNLSIPVVQAGANVLQPDSYGFYCISNVWYDQTVTITGITLNPVDPVDPPSANADIDEPVKVWTEGHTLYVYTASRETIRLYTFGGQLLKQTDNAGRLAVTGLPEGNYLIRIGDRTWKVSL